MIKYALDASALLALINKEAGWKRVMEVLPESVMSAVNLSESAAALHMLGMPKEEITSILSELITQVAVFDEEQALMAAELRSCTRAQGISLGDRACLALCKIQKLTVITADKIWQNLKLGLKIECIR